MIHFQCEHCGHAVRVPTRYAGKKGRCPACKNIVDIPSQDTDAPAEPKSDTAAEELELTSPEENRFGDTDILPRQDDSQSADTVDIHTAVQKAPHDGPHIIWQSPAGRLKLLGLLLLVAAVVVIGILLLFRFVL